VWREVARQCDGQILIEQHAHLGLTGDVGFRRFENLQSLLARDGRVLLQEALKRFALLDVIEQDAHGDARTGEDGGSALDRV